jgi:ATP-dependent RNA helicase RhlE
MEKGRRGRGGASRPERSEGSRDKPAAPRREPRDDHKREPREPRRIEPAKPKLPKLDFDPSKPYESRVSTLDTAAPEPKRSHHRPKRAVPALLGGLPKPEPEK